MILRVGELAVEEKLRSFCGDMKVGGMDDAEVPSGGVVGIAVVGRDSTCAAAASRARTFSARAMILLAMLWKISVTLAKALEAFLLSRPTMAMSAY